MEKKLVKRKENLRLNFFKLTVMKVLILKQNPKTFLKVIVSSLNFKLNKKKKSVNLRKKFGYTTQTFVELYENSLTSMKSA